MSDSINEQRCEHGDIGPHWCDKLGKWLPEEPFVVTPPAQDEQPDDWKQDGTGKTMIDSTPTTCDSSFNRGYDKGWLAAATGGVTRDQMEAELAASPAFQAALADRIRAEIAEARLEAVEAVCNREYGWHDRSDWVINDIRSAIQRTTR